MDYEGIQPRHFRRQTMRVHIATSRQIGERCIEFARKKYDLVGIDECDVFISVMYDKLVSEHFISSKVRCLNFHPGLLPEYRGSGAFSWSIINGERFCGVTLHELETDIDSGGIIDQRMFPVEVTDTAESLFKKGMDGIYDLFTTHLDSLIAGTYETKSQNQSAARTYYRRDLERQRDLTRFVKAFTFSGKNPAYFVNARGEKVELRYE